MIGLDLKKDPEALISAYNDSEGVTREFNLNLLDRINRELGGEFDREQFQHRGTYNEALGRMESWLFSLANQRVAVRGLDRRFSFRRRRRDLSRMLLQVRPRADRADGADERF